MSGPSKTTRAMVRGKGTPDGLDVNAVLEAIHKDHGVDAEIHIYQDLAGDLIVECCASCGVRGQPRAQLSHHRVFTVSSAPLDGLMLQAAHALYHEIDRLVAHAPRLRAAV